MATYVISDIHGYYSRFIDLLQQIEFDDGVDELYILGDCFDRGPQNKEMLDWVYKYLDNEHIHFLYGNHDDLMVTVLQHCFNLNLQQVNRDLFGDAQYQNNIELWSDYVDRSVWGWNGGMYTFFPLIEWPIEKIKEFVQRISQWPLFYDIEVNGQRFVLVHAGFAMNGIRMSDDFFGQGLNVSVNIKDFPEQWSQSLLWIRSNWIFDDSKLPCDVIFGHTPTARIYDSLVWNNIDFEGEEEKILHFHNKKHAIDTGRSCMGMLRLDDMKEFYSEVNCDISE